MTVKSSLLIQSSALALNAAIVSFLAAGPVNAQTLTVNGSDQTISDSSYSAVNWQSNNVTLTSNAFLGPTGIYNNGNSVGTLANNGFIYASSNGAIANTGTITAISNNLGATIQGSITNTGTITSIINAGNISGNITNTGIGTILGPLTNSGNIEGSIAVNQNLTITGGNSSTLGTLTSGLITAHNLIFDSGAYQLLQDNINVGAGTVTNNGVLQLNSSQTITGNYVQSTLATLNIGVANSNSYGDLIVSGNADLIGGSISILSTDSTKLFSGETFTIIQEAGTIAYSSIAVGATGFTTSLSSISGGGYEDLVVSLLSNNIGTYNNSSIASIVNPMSVTLSGDTGIFNSQTGTIGTLSNNGFVNGTFAGILNGGSIGTLLNAGTLQGTNAVYNNAGNIGTILNSGLINSLPNGRNSGIYNAQGSIYLITNLMGGTINGDTAIINTGTIGTLSNSGLITGYVGIFNSASNGKTGTIGTITNNGAIIVSDTGIKNYGTISNITNSGTINSTYSADIATYSGDVITGNIINSGTLIADNGGIENLGSTIFGTLINSGTIISTYNAGIENNGTLIGGIYNSGFITNANSTGIQNFGTLGNIVNSGTVIGQSNGIENFSTIQGNIINSGTIIGTNNLGLVIEGTVIGLIDNSGLICGEYTGLKNYSTILGGITNSGTITSTTVNGIGFYNGFPGVYNINNLSEGTIAGGSIGIENDGSIVEGIINSGVIIGTNANNGVGIVNGDPGTPSIRNLFGGTISGGSIGINNTGVINIAIIDSGLITGGTIGISNSGGTIGSISNLFGGTITAGSIAVNNVTMTYTWTTATSIGSLGAVSNNGLIDGSIIGINNSGSLGTIINIVGGTIRGGATGINNSGMLGAIYNSGLITGADNAIVSSGTLLGALSNAGTINGNINVNQNLTITGGSSSFLGTLAGGTIGTSNNNLVFDSASYQLLAENINVGSGTASNNGVVQLNATQSISGNYSQGSLGSLNIGVPNASNYGRLIITGNVTMANAQVGFVPLTGALYSGETFTVVQQNGGTVNYAGITAAAPDFTGSVSSISNGGYENLVVTLAGAHNYANLGQTTGGGVAPYVGTALDQINANGNISFGPILSALYNLGSGSPAQVTAVKQLAPSQLAPLQAANNVLIDQNIQVISQHQQVLIAQTKSDNAGRSAGSEYQSGAFWGQMSGGFANRTSTTDADGYHQTYTGIAMGADDHLSESTTLGLAMNWMHGRATGFDALAGSLLTTNSLQFTGYGTQQYGPAFINGMAGFGYNMFGQSRAINFLNESANSKYNGTQYMARVDGGWNIPVSTYIITPLSGLQGIWTNNNGYTETGAGATNLSVGRQTAHTLTTMLGGRVTTAVSTDWGSVAPEIKLQWEHDLLHGPITTPVLMAGVGFSTETPREAADGAQVTMAATLQKSDHLSLRAEYDGNIRSNYSSHTALLKAQWDF